MRIIGCWLSLTTVQNQKKGCSDFNKHFRRGASYIYITCRGQSVVISTPGDRHFIPGKEKFLFWWGRVILMVCENPFKGHRSSAAERALAPQYVCCWFYYLLQGFFPGFSCLPPSTNTSVFGIRRPGLSVVRLLCASPLTKVNFEI